MRIKIPFFYIGKSGEKALKSVDLRVFLGRFIVLKSYQLCYNIYGKKRVISMQTEVFITSEYITLGQFLKYENLIESGGSVKFFLEEIPVFINGEQDNRRGRKLYPGDIVSIEEFGEFIILIQK